MPVTAKLSRKFYERLGDDVAGALVDWFNAVDLTYQTQLKEINELNWERFKATLQAEIATLRGEFRAGLADLRSEFIATISATSKEQSSEVAKLRGEMDAMGTRLLKWMFVYWCGSVIAVVGLITAMGIFGPR